MRKLRVIDATCPLVTKVHLEALRFAREGRTIILIGHKDHQEIVGTSGEAPITNRSGGQRRGGRPSGGGRPRTPGLSDADNSEPVRHEGNCGAAAGAFPLIAGPASDDICYATQNRQEAVEYVAREGRAYSGGGLAQQLKLQSPGGSCRACRRGGATDRQCQRNRAWSGWMVSRAWD